MSTGQLSIILHKHGLRASFPRTLGSSNPVSPHLQLLFRVIEIYRHASHSTMTSASRCKLSVQALQTDSLNVEAAREAELAV